MLVNYNGWTDGLGHFLVVGDDGEDPAELEGARHRIERHRRRRHRRRRHRRRHGRRHRHVAADERRHGGTACEHTIVAGENPSKVATKYGITVDELRAANPGGVMDTFLVGAVLNIPSNGTC